ncbi:hypothetical protein ACSTS3_21625 [Aquimarina muelleri]|uniref:hypothetical protein n=1 Tax=Aquimarina muelleri TaxID=279356 RepID=UPI003F684937
MKTIYYLLFIVCVSIGFVSCETELIEDEISSIKIVQIDKDDAGAPGDRGKN